MYSQQQDMLSSLTLRAILLSAAAFYVATAAAVAVPTRPAEYQYETHDCFMGPPELCKNPMVNDTACRGKFANSIDAWRDMMCDYVRYDVKANTTTKDWIIIHAGGADTGTARLGDYFSVAMDKNLWGLRPCSGFEGSECAWMHNNSENDAVHISWLMPNLNESFVTFPPVDNVPETPWAGEGVISQLGLNPPELVEIYHTEGTKLLFLHEYGIMDDYPWQYVTGYNNDTKPVYICVGMVDPLADAKFAKIKSLLETGFEDTLPYRVDVINTLTLGDDKAVFGPADINIPCSGILREYAAMNRKPAEERGNVNWAWEQPDTIINSLLNSIHIQQTTGEKDLTLKNYERAMKAAWCDSEECISKV